MSERVRLCFGPKMRPDEQGALIIGDTTLIVLPTAEMRGTARPSMSPTRSSFLDKLARLVSGEHEHPYAECDLAQAEMRFDGQLLSVRVGDFQRDLEAGRDGFSAAEATAFLSVYQDARRNRLKSGG